MRSASHRSWYARRYHPYLKHVPLVALSFSACEATFEAVEVVPEADVVNANALKMFQGERPDNHAEMPVANNQLISHGEPVVQNVVGNKSLVNNALIENAAKQPSEPSQGKFVLYDENKNDDMNVDEQPANMTDGRVSNLLPVTL